jgi:hypothetical protein
MTKNEQTSKRVASAAAKLVKIEIKDIVRAGLRGSKALSVPGGTVPKDVARLVEDIRLVAASALTQTKDREG